MHSRTQGYLFSLQAQLLDEETIFAGTIALVLILMSHILPFQFFPPQLFTDKLRTVF
jgi:hypothetical protein